MRIKCNGNRFPSEEVITMNKQRVDRCDPVTRNFEIMDFRTADGDDGSHYIEGHPAVYDQKTEIGKWFYEVIERGAFDGCDFSDVIFSINHDLCKIPLARSRQSNGQSTMQLRTDDRGLYVRAQLDTEHNAEAKAVYSAIKRADIDGMSFIFYVAQEKWEDLDTDMPTRRIQQIKKVIEVSAVIFPAYAGTDIHARDQLTLEHARGAVEQARSQKDKRKNEVELLRLRNQILMKG